MINSDLFIKVDGFIEKSKDLPAKDLNISTDTRTIKKDDVFIALEGPNFNGFHFADKAIESGASVIVFKKTEGNLKEFGKLQKLYPDICFIQVEDTLVYMQNLARQHRLNWGGYVIGITGSNGKTTTKEMLLHFLKEVFENKVIATEGNFNNFIGVPLTLFKIRPEHKLIIVEMGTSYPGEIRTLADIALPDAGFITNIGHAHIEFLKSQQGIFKEKSALYDVVMEHTNKQGLFLINDTDNFLVQLKSYKNCILAGKDFRFTANSVEVDGDVLENDILIGRHNFLNLGHMFKLACAVSPEKHDSFVKAAKSFVPKKNRSSWVKFNNQNVFLDAYNANPDSMSASLKGFAEHVQQQKNNSLIIVGDMNELGDSAPSFHEGIGKLIKELGFIHAIFVGRYAKDYLRGFGDHGKCVQNISEIEKTILDQHSHIFIKGSRSLQMESLLDIS